MKRPIKLKNKITILTFVIIIIVLTIVGIIVQKTVVKRLEGQLERHVMDIAKSVAKIPDIKANVGDPGGHKIIQPIADGIRKQTDAEFIVVMDMNKIRYSHSKPDRIGKVFVGGDEDLALEGKTYTSKAIGTLGPSLRAFVPIKDGRRQVGAVAVGILVTDIMTMIKNLRINILQALIVGSIIGIVLSRFVANNIKSSMFGLEPFEIAKLLKEREAVLESIKEGILSVDKCGKITIINSEARKLIGIKENVIGKSIEEHAPNMKLRHVMESGKPIVNREQKLLNSSILTNCVPIIVEDEVVGAIASFKDMTEIKKLAEELTGVKRYVEAMRVQSHEFSNKLHAISGLIQIKEYEKALDYISKAYDSHQDVMTLITKRIKQPAIGGLLLGKSGRCKELGIEFNISKDSFLSSLGQVDSDALVTIIGNLIENSMQAVLEKKQDKRIIEFCIYDKLGKIYIKVKDNGVGISKENQTLLFKKGFTTKKDKNGGYGLVLIKKIIDSYSGKLFFDSIPGIETEFTVTLPKKGDFVD